MVSWLILNGVLLLAVYLLGSIPTGFLAGKLFKGIDIREYGSGSTGATNVLRSVGKGPAILVLLVDVLKGALAIVLVYFTYGLSLAVPSTVEPALWQPWLVMLAGLLALLAHSRSIWLGFTGGKSAATGIGILLAMHWPVGLGAIATFVTVLLLSRIVSLSSILASLSVFCLMLITHQPLPYILFAVAGGLYVILRHRSNIQRLLAGTEPRIGQQLNTSTQKT